MGGADGIKCAGGSASYKKVKNLFGVDSWELTNNTLACVQSNLPMAQFGDAVCDQLIDEDKQHMTYTVFCDICVPNSDSWCMHWTEYIGLIVASVILLFC